MVLLVLFPHPHLSTGDTTVLHPTEHLAWTFGLEKTTAWTFGLEKTTRHRDGSWTSFALVLTWQHVLCHSLVDRFIRSSSKTSPGCVHGGSEGSGNCGEGPSLSGHHVSACWFPLMRTGTKGECSCQWPISQSIPLWVQNNSLSICSRGQMVEQSGNQGWPHCGMRVCVRWVRLIDGGNRERSGRGKINYGNMFWFSVLDHQLCALSECMYVPVCMYLCVCVCVAVCVSLCIFVYLCVCVCACVRAGVRACVCVCMYVFTYDLMHTFMFPCSWSHLLPTFKTHI